MKRDHEHGLPPESRRQSAQLARAQEEILPPLVVIALGVGALLIASVMNRAPVAPRPASEPALEFPR